MTELGVGLWLRRHGFTPQRPARRTHEQQPASVCGWLDEEYPAIEAKAKAVWGSRTQRRDDELR